MSSKLNCLKIPESTFVQDKVNNLEKYMKFLQAPVKTIPFYLPPHYKFFQPNREQDKQYWKEVAIEFLKQKHNVDITRCGFPIKMYIGGPSYEPYFITLIL